MRHFVTPGPRYVKAVMVGRDTPAETRRFVEAQLAALRDTGQRRLLVSVESSRPMFRMRESNLEALLEEMARLEGLKVALTSDDPEVGVAHEYVEFLARQRGLELRAFRSEPAALDWLLA